MMAIGYGGAFEWSLTECRYYRYCAPKGRCHVNHFLAFCIWGAHWPHLTNMTEPVHVRQRCGDHLFLIVVTVVVVVVVTVAVQLATEAVVKATLIVLLINFKNLSAPLRMWPPVCMRQFLLSAMITSKQ